MRSTVPTSGRPVRRWLVLGALAVVLLWIFLARTIWTARTETDSGIAADPSSSHLRRAAPRAAGIQPAAPSAKEEAALAPDAGHRKLDPKSEQFDELVENVIPARLYTEAARECFRRVDLRTSQTLNRDQRLNLTVSLRVSAGEVTVDDAQIEKSEIGDSALERCFVRAVRGARFAEEDLPDYQWKGDLYMSLRGMKKHLAEQDDSD